MMQMTQDFWNWLVGYFGVVGLTLGIGFVLAFTLVSVPLSRSAQSSAAPASPTISRRPPDR